LLHKIFLRMRTSILLFLLLIFLNNGCKNDGASSDLNNSATIVPGAPTDPENLVVPSACGLITEERLNQILKLNNISFNIIDPDSSSVASRSCFFKWDDASEPNAGVFLQVQTNPVYNDYPQYISGYVTAKLNEGEMMLGEEQPTKFARFSAGNANGAWSYKLGRFYWSYGNDYLFMLAFNLPTLSEDNMEKAGSAIAEEVSRNFKPQTK
jgi:hypothetical protein